MSLSDFTKEQKKHLGIGVVLAVFTVILVTIGIRFSLSSISAAKSELAELTEKIDLADAALSKKDQTTEDYDRTVTRLKAHLENLPPERNYYSWATEIVYSKGREIGLEIESVDEVSNTSGDREEDSDSPLSFAVYSLRIAVHGGYEKVKQFLFEIKEDHPLVRFIGMEISSGSNPEVHNVQLFIQWPFNLGSIAEVWDDIEENQQKVAKLEALKSSSIRKEIPKKSTDEKIESSVTASVPEPKPKSAPVEVVEEIIKPEPIIVAAIVSEPDPVIMPKPAPVENIEEIGNPEPIVVPAVIQEPEPVISLEPVLSPVEDVEEISNPEPIVVAAVIQEPEPVISPEPVLSPVESVEEISNPEPIVVAAVIQEPEPVFEPIPETKQYSLNSLLVSLDSRRNKKDELESTTTASSNSDDREGFLTQLNEDSITSAPQSETNTEAVKEMSRVEPDFIPAPQYVSSEKKLLELLSEDPPKEVNEDEEPKLLEHIPSDKRLMKLLNKEERNEIKPLNSSPNGLEEDINDAY